MQFTTGECLRPGEGSLELSGGSEDDEANLSSRRSGLNVPINDGHQRANRPTNSLRKDEFSIDGSALTGHLLTLAQHPSRKIFTGSIEENDPVVQLTTGDTIDRIIKILEKRIACGFRGIEEIFKAGNYQLSRQKFESLLCALVGLRSSDEYEEVLKRLNLHTKENITYDDFMSKFRLNETVKRLWNNEARRKQLKEDAVKTYADKITDAGCIARKRWRQEDSSSPKMQLMSAAQVVNFLRKMVKERPQKVRAFFKNVQDSESAMILKDQMSHIVSELGIVMFMEEFTKFWNRFDFARTGQIPLKQFYQSLGLKDRIHTKKEKKAPMQVEKSKLAATPTSGKFSNDYEMTPPATENNREASTESPYDFDVKLFLTSKFNEGKRIMLYAWKKISSCSKEKMTRHQFRNLLEQFQIYLTPKETESFLLRYRIKENSFEFPLFLARFFDMSKAKVADKFSSARLPRGFSPRGGTIQRAEDMLSDIIHKNYIAINRELGCIEASTGGFVMVQDFLNLLKKLFNLQLNVSSIRRSLCKYNFVKDMVVDWPKLLESCSGIRSGRWTASANSRSSSEHSLRRSTTLDVTEKEPNRRSPDDGFIASPKVTQQKPRTRSAPNERGLIRSIGKVICDIATICATKSKELERLAKEFECYKAGCLTKESFLTLFNNRCGLSLRAAELESIWRCLPSSLKLDKEYVDVHLLVQYFATLDLEESSAKPEKSPSQDSLREAAGITSSSRSKGITDRERRKGTLSNCSLPVSLEKGRSAKIAFQDESGQERGPVVGKKKNVADVRDIPSSLLSLGKQLTRNWQAVELKLQDLDEEGTGFLGMDDIKVIADMMHTELSYEAIQFIQKEFANSANSYLIDYNLLFQVVKSKGNQTGGGRNALSAKLKIPSAEESDQNKESELFASRPFDFVVRKIRQKLRKNWRQLRRQCLRADRNHDGWLNHTDFVQILRSFDFDITKEEYYHLSSFFDENLDGEMPYKRFFSYIFGDP